MRLRLLFILLFVPYSFASMQCDQLVAGRHQKLSVSSEVEALEVLSQFETAIDALRAKIASSSEGLLFAQAIAQLHEKFESVYGSVGSEPLADSIKKLEKLSREIEDVEERHRHHLQAKMTTTVSDLELDPKLVLPKKVYTTSIEGRGSLSISFSKKVIDEVFKSKSDLRKQAVRASLRAINKGVIPSYSRGANGIKITENRDRIFEVVIIGQSIGQFRFLGYIDNSGIFRVVHYYENQDHSNSVRLKQVDLVLFRKSQGEI